MGRVVSNARLMYEKGEKLFRDGKPCPPKPSDDCNGNEPHSLLWIGYRVAKGMDWMCRREIAAKLNMPEPEWKE